MTVQESLERVWVTLGEPSNLDPFVYAGGVPAGLTGSGSLMLEVLNDAQTALATWRFPDGTRLRFPSLRDWFYLEADSETGTLAAGQPAGFSSLDGDFTGLTGWVIEVDGETRLALVATGTSAILDSAFGSDPSGKTWTAYKRVFRPSDALGGTAYPIALYGVYDFEGRKRISRFSETTEDFSKLGSGVGTPGLARIRGQNIIFDVAPESGRFAVEYLRRPIPLVDLDDESELPEAYHEALVLYVEQWGFARMQENDAAYARKRDLEDFLRRRRTVDDLEDDERRLTLKPKV